MSKDDEMLAKLTAILAELKKQTVILEKLLAKVDAMEPEVTPS